MGKPRVIITGANGFIGSYLVDYFIHKDFWVTAFVHSMPEKFTPTVKYLKFDLKNNIPEQPFKNADYVIHCAYSPADKNNEAFTTNLEGTKKLLELSKRNNIKKFVFLSSFSAHENAKSVYGRSKFEAEKLFNPEKDLVIKPGLVIGHGGLYLRISELIKKSKILPLIDGGKQMVQTLHIEDLAFAIEKGIKDDVSGILPLGVFKPLRMKDFYKGIAKSYGKNPIMIYLPAFLAQFAISIFQSLGIKTSVSKENISGLKHLKTYDTKESCKELGIIPKSFKETIETINT